MRELSPLNQTKTGQNVLTDRVPMLVYRTAPPVPIPCLHGLPESGPKHPPPVLFRAIRGIQPAAELPPATDICCTSPNLHAITYSEAVSPPTLERSTSLTKASSRSPDPSEGLSEKFKCFLKVSMSGRVPVCVV